MKKLVLLSGGMDSTVCMSIATKNNDDEVMAVSFDYGQRQKRELECAKAVAKYYGIKGHYILRADLNVIGGSALTDENIDVPEGDGQPTIPATYVPARNLLFLSYALSLAEAKGAKEIYIGVNSMDYSGYPDCRPDFIAKFQEIADLATKVGVEGDGVKIITPLQLLSKGDIVKLGVENNAPLHLTTTCYNGREKACGKCDSCILRLKGFEEAGIIDPIPYE